MFINTINRTVTIVLGKLPLRAVLIIPFILQIVGTVGLVGYLSFKNGQRAVYAVASQLQNEVTDRIQQNIKAYLAIPHRINQVNLNAVNMGVDLQELMNLKRYFWPELMSVSDLDFIAFINNKGNVISGQRLADGTLLFNLCNESTGFDFYAWKANEKGETATVARVIKNFDGRKRLWYQDAVKAGKKAWSQVEISFAEPKMHISAVQPVYDLNGQLEGVLNVTLRLDSISQFLQSLKVGKSGQTFIMTRDGVLVATSTSENQVRFNNSKAELFKATESNDLVTQATARYLVKHSGSFNKIQKLQNLYAEIADRQRFLQVVPYQDEQGLDWLIVAIVPESDFMEEINANTRTTILLCLIALMGATGVGILTARWVTKPIVQLNAAAKNIAKGEWNKTVKIQRSDELGQLATSFNSMAEQLEESFEHLEDKVKERTAELATANVEIAELNNRLKAENIRLGAELDIIKEMQQLILPNPHELSSIENLDIAGFMEPADEVGGDYYDVLHTDNIVTIGIGDVTGHGLESGILMVMTQAVVRTLKEIRESDPVKFLDVINRTIYKNVLRMNSEKNLTLAILNYADGLLHISGQHEETIVVRKGGIIERIETMNLGFPIGLDEDIAEWISQETIELEVGDGIVVYTDGIPEAKNIKQEFYGMENLCEVVSQNWHLEATEIKSAVIAHLRQFIGEQKVFDDITLVVFKRL